MKKHFLRVLTVLLMACLGIGILAACGDGTEPENPDNPENPAVTDPIEGVWTGATATGLFGSSTATDTFTATVDLIEGQAHAGYVVVKATEGEADYYFAFGIDKDGENYKGSMSVGSETPVSITVSLADNKLTAVIPFGEDPTTLIFTSRNATLPAAIAPTGTLYAEVNSHVTYKIDFTAKKLYAKMGSGSYTDQNVKFINVGDYIGIEPTAEGTEGAGLVPVFKSGSDYYIFVVAAGEAPIKLTATEPTPPSPPTPVATYDVTFNVGTNGTVAQGTTTSYTGKEAGNEVDIPAVTPKKGYTFKGWYKEDTTTKLTGDKYTVAAADDADENGTIAFTAQYEAISYTVKYAAGADVTDAQGMPTADGAISYDAPLTLPDDPTRANYTFAGWTATGITTPVKNADGDLALTEDMIPATGTEITLTATWTPNTPSTLADISGVWTNGTTVITIEGTHAVMKSAGSNGSPDIYVYYALTAHEEDGYYSTNIAGITFVPTAGGLTVSLPSPTQGVEEVTFNKDNSATLTHLNLEGAYENLNAGIKINFAGNDSQLFMAMEGVATPVTAIFTNVGNYIVISATMGSETMNLIVYVSGSAPQHVYMYSSEGSLELTVSSTPTPVTYTVTYALGDHAKGTTPPAPATATEDGQYKVTLPAAPAAASGYEFAGWQVGAEVKEAEAEITVSENITVTATWVRHYITDENVQAQILKSFGEGSLAKTVEDGTEVTLIATITSKIGGVYYGLLLDVNMNDDWYRLRMDAAVFTNNGEDSWTAGKSGTSLAKWTGTYPSGNIDSYNGMNGAIVVAVASLENNVLTYKISVFALTDTEYKTPIVVTQHTVTSNTDITELLLHFYYDPEGVTISNASITYPEPITSEPEPETYTVTYELGDHAATDATAPVEATATEDNEYKVTLPAAPAAAKGYRFTGWKVGDATELEEAGAQITISADTTITAQYEAINYTVKYAGEGTDGMSGGEIAFGKALTLPENPTRTGYTFAGWQVEGYTGKIIKSEELTTLALTEGMIPASGTEIIFTATWTAKTYEVTLEAGDNGTVTGEGKVEATYDDDLTLPDATPNKGYTFDGWYTAADNSGTKFESGSKWTTDGTELTLYAHYNYIEYAVEYAAGENGPTDATLPANPTDKVTLEAGHNTITLSAPTYEGTDKVFEGWLLNGTNIGSASYTIKVEDLPDNDEPAKITLTAKWRDADKVAVNYELGEHAAAEQQVPTQADITKGGSFKLAPAPQAATGYKFIGWYVKDDNGSNTKAGDAEADYTPEDVESVTLIAKYDAIEYTVRFAKGEGDVQGDAIADVELTIESAGIALSEKTGYTLEYYVLAGWKLNDTKTYALTETFTIDAAAIAEAKNGTEGDEGKLVITLTATWDKATFTVTYDYGDGTEETKDAEDIAWGETVTLVPPTAKEGYEFGGWQVEGVEGYESGNTFTMPKNAVTVTAQWTDVYTVVFDLDGKGEESAPETQTNKKVGDKIDLTKPTGKEGFEFKGWLTKDGTKVDGDQYTVKAEDAVEKTITLKADWQEVFTVKFFAEKDHYDEAFKEIKVNAGTVITNDEEYAAVGTPDKTNYTFGEWLLNSNSTKLGDGTTADSSIAEKDTHNIYVYATWTLNDTITVDETVTAGPGWNNINYVYPDMLKVGDVLTMTGKLTFSASNGWDGVFFAVSEDTNLTTASQFVALKYDWGSLGTCYTVWHGGPVASSGDPYAVLPVIKSAEGGTFSAKVSYLTAYLVEVTYTFTGDVQLDKEPSATARTWSITYQITKSTLEAFGDISIGLAGENCSIATPTFARTTHEHNFSNNNRCECGVYNPDGTETITVTTLDESAQKFTATVKNTLIFNTDIDGAWTGVDVGGTGCTTGITVSGDFAVLITFDKLRDVNFPDAFFDFNIGTDWLTYRLAEDNFLDANSPLLTVTEPPTKVSGTKPSDWSGTVKCLAVRVGSTFYFSVSHYANAQAEADWTREYTITSFKTDDMYIRIGGNTFWNDNFTAFVGTASIAD